VDSLVDADSVETVSEEAVRPPSAVRERRQHRVRPRDGPRPHRQREGSARSPPRQRTAPVCSKASRITSSNGECWSPGRSVLYSSVNFACRKQSRPIPSPVWSTACATRRPVVTAAVLWSHCADLTVVSRPRSSLDSSCSSVVTLASSGSVRTRSERDNSPERRWRVDVVSGIRSALTCVRQVAQGGKATAGRIQTDTSRWHKQGTSLHQFTAFVSFLHDSFDCFTDVQTAGSIVTGC